MDGLDGLDGLDWLDSLDGLDNNKGENRQSFACSLLYCGFFH